MDTIAFTRMDQGTREEYQFLDKLYRNFSHELPDRVIRHLDLLRGDRLGYKIDRFQHSLQTATRAQRDGADEEMVVAALLHDIGDTIAPENHSELGASVLQPYVSAATHWIVKHHGLFQGYYYFHHCGGDRNARDRYRGHPMFEPTADFCQKWDQMSFDPDYDTLPLTAFEPAFRRVFARPPFGPHVGEPIAS
ncbi:MAG TPA: HD domain-containing protein [Candidatus Cybelea sp.]|nr:HD domain-containing protein [Candidatus Cybelea sp.]